MSLIPFLVVALFIAFTAPTGLEPPWFDPADSLVAVAAITLGALLLGLLLARRFLAAPARSADEWECSARSFLRAALLYRALLLALYAAEVWLWRWPLVVGGVWGLRGWVLVDEAATLAPYLVLLAGSWIVLFPGERVLRGPGVRLGPHVLFQARAATAFVLGPLFFVVALSEGIGRLPQAESWFFIYPFTQWMLAAGVAAGLFFLSPLLLRVIWGARPLPPGPTRDRLEALARRAGSPARNYLVWPTGGLVANAAVTGIHPSLRYVMITDALLDRLNDDGIAAVVGHEFGHARHRHLLLYLAAAIGYILCAVTMEAAIERLWPARPGALWIDSGSMLLLYWGGVIRSFARRFEIQADLFGVRLCGDVEQFVGALETVGRINGQPRGIRTWLHPSIGERVSFLRAATAAPEIERTFHRRLHRMGLLLALFLGVCGAGAGIVASGQVREAPARAVRYRAWQLSREASDRYLEGDVDEAVRLLREACRLDRDTKEYEEMLRAAIEGTGGERTGSGESDERE